MIQTELRSSDKGIGVTPNIAWLADFAGLECFELGYSPKAFQRLPYPSKQMNSEVVYDEQAWRSSCPTINEIWVFGTRVV